MDWLSEADVLAIHEEQIAEHGGATGVRDAGLLRSALARPRHAAAYADADVPRIAALYALGIVKNHPFVDGNKRVGAVLLETFLDLNQLELDVTDAAIVETITALASGGLSEKAFIAWVKAHTRKQKAR